MDRINKVSKRSISKLNLTSGFENFDKIIQSFGKSNLYVLAGRPGMGKTSLGLNIVHHLALKQHATVAIISYEMTLNQITSRLLSISTDIPNDKIINQNLEDFENSHLDKKESELVSANIFVDCPATLNFKDLKSKIKDLKNTKGIDFLLVDDIQRITISDEDRKFASNREQEVSKNVRDLKALAKEIEIPILAISQLNRDNKEREDRRPILTDIRDSGAIENDSDMIIFLHRPEYYGITEDESGNSLLGIAEIEVAKNRHGALGRVHLRFKKEIPKYCDIEFNTFSFEPESFGSKMNEEFDENNLSSNNPF